MNTLAADPAAPKDKDSSKDAMMAAPSKDAAAAPSMMFTPRKVTHEDKKGLDAFFASMEAAEMKGDMATSMAMIDFPVTMLTDNAKGDGMGGSWDKKQYSDEMTATMQAMPKDMKAKHSRKYIFLSDSLAMVSDTITATLDKKPTTWKSGALMIKKDGKWMMKAMVETGWGDIPMPGSSKSSGMSGSP